MTSTACYNKNKGDTMDTTITLPAGGKLYASRSHLCLAFEKHVFPFPLPFTAAVLKKSIMQSTRNWKPFTHRKIDFPEGLSLNFYVFPFWKTDMIRQKPAPFLQRQRWNGVP